MLDESVGYFREQLLDYKTEGRTQRVSWREGGVSLWDGGIAGGVLGIGVASICELWSRGSKDQDRHEVDGLSLSLGLGFDLGFSSWKDRVVENGNDAAGSSRTAVCHLSA